VLTCAALVSAGFLVVLVCDALAAWRDDTDSCDASGLTDCPSPLFAVLGTGGETQVGRGSTLLAVGSAT
jgi:hypothetical protein